MTVEIDLSSANIPGFPKTLELKNAAEEATLVDLLTQFNQYRKDFKKASKTAEKQQKAVDKILKKLSGNSGGRKGGGGSGGGSGGGGGGNNNNNNNNNNNGGNNNGGKKQTLTLQQSLTTLNNLIAESIASAKGANASQLQYMKTIGSVSAASMKFSVSLSNMASVSMTFVRSIAGVGNSMSQAAGALSDVPVIGGTLSTMLGAVASASEDVYNEYTKLAATGANFNGSFVGIVNSATQAGLTFEQFSSIIASNSHTMMLLGGTTEAGAKRFSELGKVMKDSKVNDQLLQMGYTTEQINSGMASYIGIIGQTGALDKMSTQEIADSSAGYLKELDALAKITGKTRDEKQKEHEALQKDAQFRALTSKMSAEEQKQMMSFITSFPESSQGAIKDMISTGTATSQAAKDFAALNGNTAAEIMRHGGVIRRGGKITDEALAQTKKNAIKEAKISEERFRDQGLFNKDLSEAYLAQSDLARQDENGKEKALAEQEELNKSSEKLANEIGEFKTRVAAASNQFTAGLLNSQAIETLDTAFMSLAQFMSNTALPVINIFFAGLQPVIAVMAAVANVVGNLVGPSLKMIAFVAEKVGWVLRYTLYPVLETLSGAAKVAGFLIAAWGANLAIAIAMEKGKIAMAAYAAAADAQKALVASGAVAADSNKVVAALLAATADARKAAASVIVTAATYAFNAAMQQATIKTLAEAYAKNLNLQAMVQSLTLTKAYNWAMQFANTTKLKEIAAMGVAGVAQAAYTAVTNTSTAMKVKEIAALGFMGAAQAAYTAITNSAIFLKLREITLSAIGIAVTTGYNIAMGIASAATLIFGSALSIPIFPLILLGGAIILLITYWDEIVEGFKWGWNKIKPVFEFLASGLMAVFSGIKSLFSGFVTMIIAPFKLIGKAVTATFNIFSGIISWVKNKFSWILGGSDDDEKENPNNVERKSDGTTRTVKNSKPAKEEAAREKDAHEEKMQKLKNAAMALFGFEKQKLNKLKTINDLYNEQLDKRLESEEDMNENVEKAGKERKKKESALNGDDDTKPAGPGKPSKPPGSPGSPGKPPGSPGSQQQDRGAGGIAAASQRAQSGSPGSPGSPGGGNNPSSSPTSGKSDSGIPGKTPVAGSLDLPGDKKAGAGGGGSMSVSSIKDMIIRHEGKKNKPYKDTKGLWTVGVGHLIGDGKSLPPEWDRTFSDAEVMALFDKDYEHHRAAAERIPGFNKVNEKGQAALTDLTFNMGPVWYKKWPTFSKNLLAGNAAGAADSLQDSAWYKQVKGRAPEIVNLMRSGGIQAAEGGMFSGPDSGYPATLHGDEAVVPLKGGNIPVQMTGGGDQSALIDLFKEFNSKMDILIALNASISDSNKNQLRVQKKGLGNPEILG